MSDRSEIARKSQQKGKKIEWKWAKAMGTERLTDAAGIRQPDLRIGPWDIEIKYRGQGLKGLVDLMDQAIAKAKTGQTPVLGLELGSVFPSNARYVVMRREDWIVWNLGTPDEKEL